MKIVRSREIAFSDALQKGQFFQRRKELGSTGKLSCGLWELPPGKKSFPFHVHHVTEEAMYVVSGTGKVRSQDGLTEIGPGDWVGFPPGGTAHQLINDGKEALVYLAMGVSGAAADIVEYPDSNKVAVAFGEGAARKRHLFKKSTEVTYFDGEDDAQRD